VCVILFADLVGFTTISEGHDVEVVRECGLSELDDLDEVDRLLAFVAAQPEDSLPPDGRAYQLHYRARLNAARGRHESCEDDFLAAIAIFEPTDLLYEMAS
jgi:hypothetical protein